MFIISDKKFVISEDLNVKSCYGEYDVIFGELDIQSILEPGDFLFIDSNIKKGIDFEPKLEFEATEVNKTIFKSLIPSI